MPFTQGAEKCTLIETCKAGKCEFHFGGKMMQIIRNVRKLRYNLRFFKYIEYMSLFDQANKLLPRKCIKRIVLEKDEYGDEKKKG